MKQLLIFLFVLISLIGLSQKTVDSVSVPTIFIGVSTGGNNASGPLAVNIDYVLDNQTLVGVSVGQGSWGAKAAVLLESHPKGFRKYYYGVGLSLSAGKNEFITELEESIDGKAKISGRGRGNHTWVHPYLFIDLALAINPKLKLEVYRWIQDYLLKYRNKSGDSYKRMTGALYERASNKSKFSDFFHSVIP